MNALWAEVTLGWRRAVRGPFLAALLAVLACALVVWPGRDDPGLLRTGLGLALGWAFLLVVALWCGGTAYALDRERHRLTLAFTKPIRRWTLWWGRFFGTLAPFAVAIVALGLFLAWRPIPEGRAVLDPIGLPDLTAPAKASLERLRAENRVPEGVSEERLIRTLVETLERRPVRLAPGETRTYHFPAIRRAGPVTFRLAGRPFLGARDAIRLAVTVRCAGKTATLRPEALQDGGITLDLPPDLLTAGEPIDVTLAREDAVEAGVVVYRERADVALLAPGRAPLLNLAAFCLVLLGTVAMAVALGMALGCAFSLPVTLFAGTLALLAIAAASLAPEAYIIDEIRSFWSRLSTQIANGIAWPFRDLVALNPQRALLTGEALRLSVLLRILALAVFPWCLACSLVATLSSITDEDK